MLSREEDVHALEQLEANASTRQRPGWAGWSIAHLKNGSVLRVSVAAWCAGRYEICRGYDERWPDLRTECEISRAEAKRLLEVEDALF